MFKWVDISRLVLSLAVFYLNNMESTCFVSYDLKDGTEIKLFSGSFLPLSELKFLLLPTINQVNN